jgi:SIR2-like domain
LDAIKHLFIVGAGFSRNAGLPLATEFTQKLLDVPKLKNAPSEILVECMRSFVDEVFGDRSELAPEDWPQLEDLFTTIDLAANTGHNLGPNYSASDLRTIRRTLIVRLIRMLSSSFNTKKRNPDEAREYMTKFFSDLLTDRVAFLSMNWDCVIEAMLDETQGVRDIDYGCSAIAAVFKNYAVQRRSGPPPKQSVQVLKPHGSVNWMYCDACSRLYWFPASVTRKIASQLFKDSDGEVVKQLIRKRLKPPVKPAVCPDCGAQALGTRFATFSYRKALEFPMHYATWGRAEELLRKAHTWIFIGYSLPAADYQFKHLLKRVHLSRRPRPRLLVVTKNSDKTDKTIENYQRFFGTPWIHDADLLKGGMDRKTLDRLLGVVGAPAGAGAHRVLRRPRSS